ncbi:MAG: glycosyltransferase family 4 protein [Patescibacteria group bacterium]
MGTAAKRALIHDPYWESLGGGERYTCTFVELLLEQNWEVDIYWHRDVSKDIMERFGIDISKAHYCHELITNNYDLVFWLSDGSLPVSKAKKTIIHLQQPFHQVGGKNIKNLIKSRFYTFVANSKFTKSFVDREFMINSKVIYPPVQTEEFKPGPKFKQILYVARFSNLTQLKGHSILIESFKRISNQIPDWKFVLAGNTNVGTAPSDIEKLKDMAIGSNIEFVLNPNLKDLRMLNSKSSIFWSASGFGVDEEINPEKVEHFGITVVEAMSAGAVPIITNMGGYREIVTNGEDGYLWDTSDQLEKITVELARDTKKTAYMSNFAQNKSKMFSIGRFKNDFIQLIK